MIPALLLLGWVAQALDRGTVLVTGASRGIGAACAKRLAKDGYVVAVNYCSDADAAARVVNDIVEDGGSAEAFQADVSTEAAVVGLFEAIDASPLPPLTGLVNNAGIIGFDMPQTLETATTDAFEQMMATNLLGPLMCCREAAKRMAPGSAVVNLSSGSAYLGRPLLYSMSKGALNSMQHGLIEPLAAKGIRINTVSPGVTETDMVPICVEINQCVGCITPSSRHRVDGVEVDAMIQRERAVKLLISTQGATGSGFSTPRPGPPSRRRL